MFTRNLGENLSRKRAHKISKTNNNVLSARNTKTISFVIYFFVVGANCDARIYVKFILPYFSREKKKLFRPKISHVRGITIRDVFASFANCSLRTRADRLVENFHRFGDSNRIQRI